MMMLYDPSSLLPVSSCLCCNPDALFADFLIFLHIVYPCFWLPISIPLPSDVAMQHFSWQPVNIHSFHMSELLTIFTFGIVDDVMF